MKKQKKGISLIVLVITIIVMIILASAVIISLSNSNIITKAKEAVLKTDVKNFAQELSVSLAEEKLNNKDLEFDNVTETDLEEIKKYIPNFDEKYKGKIFIQNGELVYDLSKVTENEKVALESMGIKSGKIYAPAEIKAIIESKNLGANISTTDITSYVEGLSKAEAEKYTIFKGNLYYRYEKTTYEEQLELHAAGVSILMGDANEDGTLTIEDSTILVEIEMLYELPNVYHNIVYVSDLDPDLAIGASDAGIIGDCVLLDIDVLDYILACISLEKQHPDRISFIGDYMMLICTSMQISVPSNLTTTDYNVMKQYFPEMTGEMSKKFVISEGSLVYKSEVLTENEITWANEIGLPYI